MFARPPFLARYRSPAWQAPRLERILAASRAAFTAVALGAIYIDPTEPARYATLTYSLLAAYAAYSLIIVGLLPRLQALPRAAILLHGADIAWTSALTFFSQGPVSPFFLFFLFVLLAAAFRWGLRETMATALLSVAILLAEAVVLSAASWRPAALSGVTFETTPLVIRATYVLLVGGLAGYLAEQDKALRAEVGLLNDAAAKPHVELGFGGSIEAFATLVCDAFDASAVTIVVRDHGRERTGLWTVERSSSVAMRSRVVSLGARQQALWLFEAQARAWFAKRDPTGTYLAVTLDETGGFTPVTVAPPARVAAARPHASAAAVDFGLPGEWTGRLFVFDPTHMPGGLHALVLLAEGITPVLSNVFLLRRLRSRAGAVERARVARELHDGAIQALIGIEMDAEAVRQAAEPVAPSVARDIGRIQEMLRQEITALRELMQQLQPVDIDAPHHLPDVLAGIVEKFRRDSGIAARFVANAETSGLPLRACREVVRIVQEALSNVRRHSHAKNVLVQVTEAGEAFTLVVEDDGRGFVFEGILDQREMAARRLGPAVILQRVRLIGGSLTIDSSPGAGARLEVRVHVPSSH